MGVRWRPGGLVTDAQDLALWADRLRDISATGLRYAENVYDRERYERIQDLAMEMIAAATGESLDAMEPLRAPVFSRPSPMLGADAAIIDDGEILLIRRSDNHMRAMPGGMVEVGETAVEAALREAVEETGLSADPVGLIGIYDSRLWGGSSRHHLYYLVFLCRPREGREAVPPPHQELEVLETSWFAEDSLPPEQEIDPGHVRRIPHAFAAARGGWTPHIDLPGS